MKQQKEQQSGIEKSGLLYETRFNKEYLGFKYLGTWVAVSFIFVCMLLPAIVQDFIANRLGDLVRNINSKRRRIARKNIDLCFPELDSEQKKQILRKNFRHQARSMLHYGLIWWAPRFIQKHRIKITGEENIQAALKNKRSVIIMAAHSLGLEAAVSATTLRYPVSGPFNPMKNKLIDWLVARGRVRHGTHIYTRKAGLRPVIKDVRSGRVMFYLPDEDLGKERCIFSPFFGVLKATVPVLGRLSKTCGADVIPCMTCYDESSRKYIVHYLPAMNNFPVLEDDEDTATMNAALEQIIRICPENYFWSLKLFKTRPEGESGFYDS